VKWSARLAVAAIVTTVFGCPRRALDDFTTLCGGPTWREREPPGHIHEI
jgi:hypothetical protein